MKIPIFSTFVLVGLMVYALFQIYLQTIKNQEFNEKCSSEGGIVLQQPSTKMFTTQWGCYKLGSK